MIKQNEQIYQSCHAAYWEIYWYFPHRSTGKLNEVRILRSIAQPSMHEDCCHTTQNGATARPATKSLT